MNLAMATLGLKEFSHFLQTKNLEEKDGQRQLLYYVSLISKEYPKYIGHFLLEFLIRR